MGRVLDGFVLDTADLRQAARRTEGAAGAVADARPHGMASGDGIFGFAVLSSAVRRYSQTLDERLTALAGEVRDAGGALEASADAYAQTDEAVAGNSYDDGVEFKVAADDFADIFYDVSVSGAR